MRLKRSIGLSLAAGIALLLVLAGGTAVWRAKHSLDAARTETASAGKLRFSFGPARLGSNPGFEPVSGGPAEFASAAVLDGHIVLGGAGGLQIWNEHGEPEVALRPGIELPAAPVSRLLVARPPGDSRTRLLVATAGAGVLVLSAPDGAARDAKAWTGGMRQLLPEDAGLRDVTALASMPGSELLLGTRRGGLLRWNGERLELYRPEYRGAAITALLVRGDEVWAGTQDSGLLHTHGGVTDRLNGPAEGVEQDRGASLPDRHVHALAGGPDRRVYAGTPLGVEAFDPEGRPERRLAEGTFTESLAVNGSELMVGTLEDGAQSVRLAGDGARERIAAAPAAFGGGRVEGFLTLPGSQAPLAVHPNGLYRQGAGGAWQRALELPPDTAPGMASRNIAALLAEPGGRLWIGYFDRGLDVMNVPDATDSVRHLEDDHLFCINRLTLDPARRTVAAATANGLVLFDAEGRPRQVLGRHDGLLSDHVSDVSFTPERMAVATTAGLTFIGPGGAQSLYAFQGLVNNHVYALADGDGGELVAGTLGGLSVLERDAVRVNLTVANSGLKHNWVTALAPADGGYLVGTYGAGVMRLGRDSRVQDAGSATRDMIVNNNALLLTADHVLAGTLGQGLWVENRHNGRWTHVAGGLPSLNVTAFAERDSDIYVGTENGLVRIAERRLP